MKKLLIFALAAMSMVACVKEEVTLLPQGDAISFENAFIDNATRAAEDPSTTVNTLNGFNVWGFVKEYDGVIFDGVEVTKNGGVWSYQGTQYWVPNQPYYFAALAPMNSANWGIVSKATDAAAKLGLGTVDFTNVDGTEDLLYAKEKMTSKGLNEPNGAVKFQFQHLLSKVKFTFKNGFPTETASIKVTNVKMTVPQEAEIDLAQADYSKAWTSYANTTTLSFGDVEKLAYTQSAEVAYERLTIPAPATQSYTVTFDVELFMGAQSVYTVAKTSVVTGAELEMGKAYNFSAEINPANLELEEIVFDVHAVEGWTEPTENVDVAFAELKAAAAQGGNYTLYKDINITEAVNVSGDLTLNLNGHKLYNSTDIWSDEEFALLSVVGSGAKLTIEGNGTVEAKENDCYAVYVANGGEVTINGGTYIGNIHAVYVSNDGGVANLNGGYYDIKQKYNATAPYRMLLNCGDTGYKNGISKIIVKGGEYVGFDPANNDAEGAGTSYVATGYKSEANGNNYVVVHE